MQIDILHIVGFVAVLIAIAVVGSWSGKKVSTAEDFTTGAGRAGTFVVAGTIMGTLVSGQATIGTAQLAFSLGVSAWWFTLGSGIGCLILAIAYVARMRSTGHNTLVGVIVEEYGDRIDVAASVFSAIGIFISVIAQMIAASALFTSLVPMEPVVAVAISATIMAIYVIFGGVWGAGIGGVVKLALLYAACIVGGCIVLGNSGGPSGVIDSVVGALGGTDLGAVASFQSSEDVVATYLSMFARGPLHDLGSALSLVLGVISTQSYASAIWSAKTTKTAKRGALISACLIPPIGVVCILIGMYMRGTCITADEIAALGALGQSVPEGMMVIASSAQAFPQFIIHAMPPLFGGVALGALFITVVGGGAGLVLGATTIIVEDLFGKYVARIKSDTKRLFLTRSVIAVLLFLAAIIALVMPGTLINDLGFLSMGLRGAVIFTPFTFALYARGKVGGGWALGSVIAGPVFVLLGNAMKLPVDPLFVGMAATLVIMLAGMSRRQSRRDVPKHS